MSNDMHFVTSYRLDLNSSDSRASNDCQESFSIATSWWANPGTVVPYTIKIVCMGVHRLLQYMCVAVHKCLNHVTCVATV